MLDAMRPEKRLAAVLAGALAFGLFAAWAKGPGTDGIGTLSQLRAGIGNVSTPWLLVAFLAGAQARRLRSGAALGLAATAVAHDCVVVTANQRHFEGVVEFLNPLRLLP